MGDPWYAVAFGAHYPLLYAHRDDAEARRCLALLPSLAPLVAAGPGGPLPILDLGCGDGRHLEALEVGAVLRVGLDLSPNLLRAAAGRLGQGGGGGAALLRGDMRRLPCGSGTLGTVLSLFTSFGYFGPLRANAPVIREIGRVLAPGGHWFLDHFDGRLVRAELAAETGGSLRRRDLGPLVVTEVRCLDPDGELVRKRVVLEPKPGQGPEAAALGVGPQGLRYEEQVALFDLPELDELAASCGLHRVAQAVGYDGRPLGQGDRWLLAYRRRGPREEGSP